VGHDRHHLNSFKLMQGWPRKHGRLEISWVARLVDLCFDLKKLTTRIFNNRLQLLRLPLSLQFSGKGPHLYLDVILSL
jgi:hypothetical protein